MKNLTPLEDSVCYDLFNHITVAKRNITIKSALTLLSPVIQTR